MRVGRLASVLLLPLHYCVIACSTSSIGVAFLLGSLFACPTFVFSEKVFISGEGDGFLGARPRMLAASSGEGDGMEKSSASPVRPKLTPRVSWLLAEYSGGKGGLKAFMDDQLEAALEEGKLLMLAMSEKAAGRVKEGDLEKATEILLRQGLNFMWAEMWLKAALFAVDPTGDGSESGGEKAKAVLEQHLRAAATLPPNEVSASKRLLQLAEWTQRRSEAHFKGRELKNSILRQEAAVAVAKENYQVVRDIARESEETLNLLVDREKELSAEEREIQSKGFVTKESDAFVQIRLALRKLRAAKAANRKAFEVLQKVHEKQVTEKAAAYSKLQEAEARLASLRNSLRTLCGGPDEITWSLGGFPPLTAEEKRKVHFGFLSEADLASRVRVATGSQWKNISHERRAFLLEEYDHFMEWSIQLIQAHNALQKLRRS